MIWPLLIGVTSGLLTAEVSAWVRGRVKPRHANPPAQPKHTFAEWLARQPVDLDQAERDRRPV